jgi:hypothetical protein
VKNPSTFCLDKIMQFQKNNMVLGTYNDRGYVALKLLIKNRELVLL